MAGQVAAMLMPFFVQYVLQPPHHELWTNFIVLVGLLSSIVGTPLWLWMSSEGVRHRARAELRRRGGRRVTWRDYTQVTPEWNDLPGFKLAANNAYERELRAAGEDREGRARCCRCALFRHRGAIDKRWVWLVGWALGMPVAWMMLLTLGKGDAAAFAVYVGFLGITIGGSRYLFRAIRADIIDYDEFLVGTRREAQFIMYLEMLPRWASIILHAAIFTTLRLVGYKSGVAEQPLVVQTYLRALGILLPLTLATVAWFFAMLYPIDDVKHEVRG